MSTINAEIKTESGSVFALNIMLNQRQAMRESVVYAVNLVRLPELQSFFIGKERTISRKALTDLEENLSAHIARGSLEHGRASAEGECPGFQVVIASWEARARWPS